MLWHSLGCTQALFCAKPWLVPQTLRRLDGDHHSIRHLSLHQLIKHHTSPSHWREGPGGTPNGLPFLTGSPWGTGLASSFNLQTDRLSRFLAEADGIMQLGRTIRHSPKPTALLVHGLNLIANPLRGLQRTPTPPSNKAVLRPPVESGSLTWAMFRLHLSEEAW